MSDWFFDWQFKIILVLAIICVPIVFAFDHRGFAALIIALFSLVLSYFGNKLYEADTSENWLTFSYSNTLKNVVGSVLIGFAWMIFLRGVLALAIASILLKVS